MSDSWASSPIADLPNCPSCGNPLLHAPDNKCPLCGHVLDADVAVSDDATPYASSPRKSYGHTLWWLVTAGNYRLGHIARMRRSSASARFARFNLLLLAASAVLITLPHHGWQRIVDYGATYPDGYPQPANSGWHLQGMTPAPQGSQSGAGKLVRLWWNPGLWSVSLGLNFVIVLLLGGLVLLLARVGSNRALRAPHRDEGRFSAAIHYSTVHIAMLFLAACCYGSGILHDFAEVMQWSVHWPKNVHRVPAFVLAGLGFFLYWFWMLRIAHSSPPETRGRVSRYFGFWVPLEAALLIGGWIVGQHHGLPYLARLLKMGFHE